MLCTPTLAKHESKWIANTQRKDRDEHRQDCRPKIGGCSSIKGERNSQQQSPSHRSFSWEHVGPVAMNLEMIRSPRLSPRPATIYVEHLARLKQPIHCRIRCSLQKPLAYQIPNSVLFCQLPARMQSTKLNIFPDGRKDSSNYTSD